MVHGRGPVKILDSNVTEPVPTADEPRALPQKLGCLMLRTLQAGDIMHIRRAGWPVTGDRGTVPETPSEATGPRLIHVLEEQEGPPPRIVQGTRKPCPAV